jgi:excisionase family DNA binding protein
MTELQQQLNDIKQLIIVQQKELLTVDETAMLLGVSLDHAYRLTSGKSPEIGFYKPKGKIKYIEKAEVLNYMRQNRTDGAMDLETKADQYFKTTKRAA